MSLLTYGLITGIIFGFLIQKARVVRYDKQVGALRLLDMTIIKFMFSAVFVGMIGIYFLYGRGVVGLQIKPVTLGANIIGGLMFGIGWGLLGYCPATQLGALGEGRWDALWGILGMLLGVSIFARVYPALKETLYAWADFGKITLPQALGLNHWIVILLLIIFGTLLLGWFEEKGL
ncbi:MAG: YeeE/YedE family protein [Candidatus Omnitrophota bacterium]|nr:MAG: YeeE/YedE family protein [Candidatus Omnitrophota bacterium]